MKMFFDTKALPPAVVKIAFACLSVLSLVPAIASDNQESKQELVFGMSTALTGPAANLGLHMKEGVELAFQEKNSAGGIRGAKLRLSVLDDGYEPARTAPNMRQLIEEQNVLAVIGNVGTPTAIAAVPIANATRTPFIGAYTGAGVLRKTPPDRYIINYRASYAEETAAMVNALIGNAGMAIDEIAFFTQRDGYGDAGFIGGINALKQHGLKDENRIAHGRYERNTVSVETGLAEIVLHETPPRAIIMVGAYAPCAEFIRLAKSFDYDGLFLNVSFVGASSLSGVLQDEGEGVIVTQVVPHPNSKHLIAKQYRAAMNKWQPSADPTFGSFEGYIAARIVLLALESSSSTTTREGLVEALEGLGEFSLGFERALQLSATNHQASHSVWPTMLRNEQIVPFEWSTLGPIGKGK